MKNRKNRTKFYMKNGDAHVVAKHGLPIEAFGEDLVDRVGIEPTTHRLRVCCSTD